MIASTRLGTHRELLRVWLSGSADPQPGSAIADGDARRAVRALGRAQRLHFPGRILFVRLHEHDLTFVLASGLELRLGDVRAIRLKLAVAAQIAPKLLQSGGYAYLDVSVPGRPVAGADSKPAS